MIYEDIECGLTYKLNKNYCIKKKREKQKIMNVHENFSVGLSPHSACCGSATAYEIRPVKRGKNNNK